jgi:predicted nucleotidyltransferase
MEKRAEKSDRLFQVVESQQGYFTSADAKKLGYDYPHQYFHVKQGNWIRVDHGIYRLKNFPLAAHEDLMRWWLWSRKKGVISHETAAALYELGDVLPSKIHLTVPLNFRKKPGRGVMLRRANLERSEITMRNGFPVTTPLRTLTDLAATNLEPERLSAVARDAIQKGLVNSRELPDALLRTTRAGGSFTQAISQPLVARSSGEISAGVRELLRELKAGLKSLYEERLKGFYLYGSYARGEEDEESDVDVLVVLNSIKRYGAEIDRTSRLISELSLKYNLSISRVFVAEQDWLHGKTPFLENVREEALAA